MVIMVITCISTSFDDLIIQLRKNKVIVYPTESVFGLGCDPDSQEAVNTLLHIKRRSWRKGLILVAANYSQLLKYIDDRDLTPDQWLRVYSSWPGPVTWTFPAKVSTPYWLTGQFSSIAVRVSSFKPIQSICLSFKKPLVSTSANISGYAPARTIQEVYNQFGNVLSIMPHDIMGLDNPTRIQDIITGKIVRE